MIPKWILIMFAALFVISFSPSYAQHHSGALAPPIDLDGLKVSLSAILSPEDFNYEETKNANLSIRFFDSDTNVNIKSVTYRVQIFQENNLVANEYFFDEDGKLDLEIRPTTGCQEQSLWKCTKYFGEKHAIAGAYYARGDSIPVIQGPIFDKSGEYNVKISIVGATNPKTMTTKDLLFETFLHIPQKETFLIKTANAQEFPISIKSHNKISNFSYDESSKKIAYEISSHNHEYDQQHDFNNNQIISVQKDFLSFKQGYSISVFVEGIRLQDSSFEFDTSPHDKNTIRINIPHEELVLVENKLNSENTKNTIKVEVFSGDKIEFNQLDFKFENGFTAKVLWDSKLNAGKKIPFTFSFFDANNNLTKDILFAYSILDSGKEIWSNVGTAETHIGILAPNGIIQEDILIPTDGKFQLKLILTGQNSKNFEKFLTSISDFSIVSQSPPQEKTIAPIPTWIKNNAKWWASGQIDDNSFIEGIQFLIKEGLMKISITEQNAVNQNNKIPDWIKNNAGWWADDLISERDFVKGIEFLASQGIIKVN